MSRIEWRSRRRTFEITDTPLVMGIVNVTPDSFSDGGRYDAPSHAIARARELVAEGADIVDLGAESTRPGSRPVPADDQLRRLLPVVEALAGNESACLSVDTASAEVADRVLAMGTDIVNDTSGLGDPAMAGVVARHGAGLVLMHIQGTPATMQLDPRYEDVGREVRDHLREHIARARAAGVREEAIAVDPGIGFGKTAAHNFELLARLEELAALGRPVMVGVSRKSFLGQELGLPVDQRLEAGLAATAIAVFLGARIIRTHDVTATRRAASIAARIREARGNREPSPR